MKDLFDLNQKMYSLEHAFRKAFCDTCEIKDLRVRYETLERLQQIAGFMQRASMETRLDAEREKGRLLVFTGVDNLPNEAYLD